MTDEKNRIQKGTLYLVATPIGNLADLSPRALKVLGEVDFVAAEDTRNTRKMLSLFEISRPMVPYHEHNRMSAGEEICERLSRGESCALVTDAGTPAVSDPGEDLVRLCVDRGIPVTSVPGCCAAINALTLSGLPTGRFSFEGFLPSQAGARAKALDDLKLERRTMIFHEAPHRLLQTLSDMRDAFGGDRRLAVCREMTKLNEEVLRMTIDQAVQHFEASVPRGEFVLVVAGSIQRDAETLNTMSVEDHFNFYIKTGLDRKEAVKAVARDRKVPKNDIYMAVMGIREDPSRQKED